MDLFVLFIYELFVVQPVIVINYEICDESAKTRAMRIQ